MHYFPDQPDHTENMIRMRMTQENMMKLPGGNICRLKRGKNTVAAAAIGQPKQPRCPDGKTRVKTTRRERAPSP